HGIHREVIPLERIVRTEIFDFGCNPSAEQLGTLALTEHAGKTTITVTVLFPSKEARDGALAFGYGARHGSWLRPARRDFGGGTGGTGCGRAVMSKSRQPVRTSEEKSNGQSRTAFARSSRR